MSEIISTLIKQINELDMVVTEDTELLNRMMAQMEAMEHSANVWMSIAHVCAWLAFVLAMFSVILLIKNAEVGYGKD